VRFRNLTLWAIAICAVIGFFGTALYAGYEAMGKNAPSYYENLDLLDVYDLLLAVSSIEMIVDAAATSSAMWLFSGLIIASLGLMVSWHDRVSRMRCVILSAQWLIVWPGWIGLILLPLELFYFLYDGADGEWIAEGWLIVDVSGVWLAITGYLFYGEFRCLKERIPA